MARRLREQEARLLEQIACHRQEYRVSRAAKLVAEQEQRHARGEVYVSGCWVPQMEAARIIGILRRREFLALIEIAALLMLLMVSAFGVWSLFGFLLLP